MKVALVVVALSVSLLPAPGWAQTKSARPARRPAPAKPVAPAVNVAGLWEGTVPGRDAAQPIVFDFTVNGQSLTGQLSGPAGDTEILDGRIKGTMLMFTTQRRVAGLALNYYWTGTVGKDQIAFSYFDDDRRGITKLTVKRPAEKTMTQ